jgi:TonB-linked SusC/RagA family outer membrane protein
MRKKLCFLLGTLLLFAQIVTAQAIEVSGKVTDEKGAPVPFVTVVEKSTKKGVSGDAMGNFKISTKQGAALIISAIGFSTTEVTVKGSSVTVEMSPGGNTMEEIVVTAGGIKSKRKELGTASTVIKAENLVSGKSVTVAGGLQGKVAGLQINATDGGANPNFRVVLRGQRSLTGNNQALLVLDNIIVPNDVLGNLNPQDVEEITVLNGAGAAALYGSQASNGAIVVTTKKGKKGVSSVTISNTVTLQNIAFYPKIQKNFGAGGSAYGFDANGRVVFSYLENQSYGPAFDGTMRPLGAPLEDGTQDSALYAYNPGHYDFWNTGVTNQSDISLTSGDDNSTFYLSGQFVNVQGTTPGDKYNRASLRLNGTKRIRESVNITYSIGYVQNRYNTTTQTGAMYGNMLNMPSNVDITKYKNWRTDPLANPNGFYNPWYQNPYFTADNNRSKTRNDYLTGNVELKFTPIKGLDLVARQGISTRNFSNKNTVGAFRYTEYAKHTDQSSKSDIAASVSDGSGYTTNLLTDLFSQYNRKIATDFSLNVVAGVQIRHDETKSIGVSGSGLVVPGLFNVSNRVGEPGASEGSARARQFGAYADARIGYKNFLFLHGTARKDWVSILNSPNNSFFYPSVDVSFIATDAIEGLRNNKILNYLKLRAGWSKVGQVNLSGNYGAYQLLPTFGQAYGFPYSIGPGFTAGNTLVAPNLKPELTRTYEAGADMNFWDNRIISSITYFKSNTDDQTITTSVSNATGYSGLRTNVGETSSQGIEATAHVDIVRTKNWSVNVGGNYTYLDNKVISIDAQLPKLALATYGNSSGSYAVPGYVFPVVMGYDYKRDPATGKVIVDGITGLPSRSDTISILGNGAAKHTLGVDGTVKYKSFTFSFVAEYRTGGVVLNNMGAEMDWSGTGYRTGIYNRDRFVYPNSVIADPANPGKYLPNTNITIKDGNGNAGFWTDGVNRDVTSNYVTSGAFWKLREVRLSYDLSKNIISKVRFIKAASISVQGRNLLILLPKDNLYTDPEFSDAGSGSNGLGLTGIGSAPPSRYYGATLSLTF